jgi:hypothetical protein
MIAAGLIYKINRIIKHSNIIYNNHGDMISLTFKTINIILILIIPNDKDMAK